jgi:hypothetical protein
VRYVRTRLSPVLLARVRMRTAGVSCCEAAHSSVNSSWSGRQRTHSPN